MPGSACFVPAPAGWILIPPTTSSPAEEHILVAYGRDFDDVSPVAGILTGGGEHEVKVSVDVEEIPPPTTQQQQQQNSPSNN